MDGDEAVERLAGFTPQPTFTVRSGWAENVDAYWRLSEPVSMRAAERAQRRLAHALAADMRATDVTRGWRPPGTFNFSARPPLPVFVERSTEATFSLEAVAGDLPDPDRGQQRAARQSAERRSSLRATLPQR